MKGYNIGDFDRRVTFQLQPEIDTSFNSPKKGEWENIPISPTRWAGIVPVTGHEQVEGSRENYKQVMKIRIQYCTDLDQQMSFLLGGVRHHITSIIEPKGFRKTLLEITGYQDT